MGGLVVLLAVGGLALGFKPYWGCAPGLKALGAAECAVSREGRKRPRAATERRFIVAVAPLEASRLSPSLAAFGEIAARRVLELRAPAAGRIVEIGPDFVDGARVSAGTLLFKLDPEPFETRRDDAAAALAEATAERADAEAALALAEAELDVAIRQRALRVKVRERQAQLNTRGLTATTELETAELAEVESERDVIQRRQALAAATLRAAQAALKEDRAALTLQDALRTLAETETRAAFDGVVIGAPPALGALVSANEALGSVYDPTSLEATFRVSNAAFGRLIRTDGTLAPLPVTATLELGARMATASGALARVSGQVDMTAGGRQLYADLPGAAATALKPGDFVSVTVAEPALEAVAAVPIGALDAEGRLLILGDGDRLRSAAVTVLRRNAERAIIADAPWGAEYVLARSPQIGAGILVTPERDGVPAPAPASDKAAAAPAAGAVQ